MGGSLLNQRNLKEADSLFLLLRFSLNEPKGESVFPEVAWTAEASGRVYGCPQAQVCCVNSPSAVHLETQASDADSAA